MGLLALLARLLRSASGSALLLGLLGLVGLVGLLVLLVRLASRLAIDWPPDWASLIAWISCGFFMEPAPLMPRPLAIALRSATSMVLSPPLRFFAAPVGASAAEPVGSMVSVT